MTLTYVFTDPQHETIFLPALTSAAEGLQHPLAAGTPETADVHFLHAGCAPEKRSGFKVALGEGWDDELRKLHGIQFDLPAQALDPVAARMFVNWLFDRVELRKVSPLRHDLGNFVVILLGRIMRMKLEATTEHTESLENLHRRLSELYQKFDDLKIPRP